MGAMFNRTSFNQDVSDWDVSNVTNMRFMFATSPFDQDLSNWDISGMLVPGAGGIASKMFYATSSFSTANYDLLLVGSDRRFVKSRPEKGSNCKARGKPLASITC